MTGYIEIELGGQMRQLKFGLHAVLSLQKSGFNEKFAALQEQEKNSNPDEIDPTVILPVLDLLIHAGIACQDYIKNRPLSCTIDQVREWVNEDLDVEMIQPIFECFRDSKAVGKAIEAAEKAQQKLSDAQKGKKKQ